MPTGRGAQASTRCQACIALYPIRQSTDRRIVAAAGQGGLRRQMKRRLMRLRVIFCDIVHGLSRARARVFAMMRSLKVSRSLLATGGATSAVGGGAGAGKPALLDPWSYAARVGARAAGRSDAADGGGGASATTGAAASSVASAVAVATAAERDTRREKMRSLMSNLSLKGRGGGGGGVDDGGRAVDAAATDASADDAEQPLLGQPRRQQVHERVTDRDRHPSDDEEKHARDAQPRGGLNGAVGTNAAVSIGATSDGDGHVGGDAPVPGYGGRRGASQAADRRGVISSDFEDAVGRNAGRAIRFDD